MQRNSPYGIFVKMSGQRVGFKHFWPIVVLALIGLLFASIVARFIQQSEQRKLKTAFVHAATDDLHAIRTNLVWHLDLLEAVTTFSAASSAVTRQEFSVFVKPMLEKRVGIAAIQWLPRVPAQQRLFYERVLRNDGALPLDQRPRAFTEYNVASLIPARPRPVYYPIYYQEPLSKASLPVGFDIGSEPTLLATLNAAFAQGQRVVIDQDLPTNGAPQGQFALQVLQPIRLTTVLTTTSGTTLLPTAGFVTLLLQVDQVIDEALNGVMQDDVYFYIYDVARQRQLYHYPPSLVGVPNTAAVPLPTQVRENDLIVEEPLTIAGEEWLMVLQPTPAYLAKNRVWFHWLVFASSLSLTGSVGFYLYFLLNRKQQSEMVVHEQAAQLRQVNQQLQETLQELQFQKTLLECTSEAAQDGVLVVSPARKWLFFNRQFLAMWQIPPAIVAQRSSPDAIRWVLTQVQDAPQVKERIEALYTQPDAHSADEIHFKNGTTLERFSAPVKGADGTHFGRVWYYHDITQHKRIEDALRQSEARNRAFISAIPDLLFRVDKNGTFIDYHHAPGYMAVKPAEEFLGRNAAEIFPPVAAQALKERIAAVLASGEMKIVEYEMPMLNGEMRSWEQRVVMLTAAEVLLIIRDVTARKQTEIALLASQQALQARQQRERALVEEELTRLRNQLVVSTRFATLGQVAATIAHELRNPLGAVRNAVYYIRRYLVQDQQELLDFLQIIDIEVTTADRIITDLLEMTRAKEPSVQQLDFSVVAQEIWCQSKQTAAIDFRCRVPQEPFWVMADPTQFRQVLANLMTNAIQAMPNGGVLHMTGEQQQEYVMITVQDTGAGVPAALRERIFEPLFTTKAKGTGLGLAICRQIIGRHGGTIALHDSAEGARFVIRLPAYPVALLPPAPS